MKTYAMNCLRLFSWAGTIALSLTALGCMTAMEYAEVAADSNLQGASQSSPHHSQNGKTSSANDTAADSSPSAGDSSNGGQSDASVPVSRAMSSAMDRWNAIYKRDPSAYTLSDGFNFAWDKQDKFPHPTFKGGSERAYNVFGSLLLSFLSEGDNFEFLQKNSMFDAELAYVTDTGSILIETTFSELTYQLSTGDFCTWVGETTCSGLEGYSAKMSAAE